MIPALLKGFFERTTTPDFAHAAKSNNPIKRGLLGGKSARIIQTTSMPSLVYRMLCQEHGTKALNNMLKLCDIAPIRITYFGTFEETDTKRKT